jgi:hypothetical protein
MKTQVKKAISFALAAAVLVSTLPLLSASAGTQANAPQTYMPSKSPYDYTLFSESQDAFRRCKKLPDVCIVQPS